jgi:toxin-antitoxin system PIN domain toxin
VILVDANLLIYAKFSDLPQHARARSWLEEELRSRGKVGIPWQSSLAFLRLATNPRLFGKPLAVGTAWQQVTEWLNHPRVWIPEATEAHPAVLGELLVHANITGNLVPDAHLAALAIEHGLTVCSADADFARFPNVSWFNPIKADA